MKSDQTGLLKTLNYTEILANMDMDHLYNQQMWGDLWLDRNKPVQNTFNTDGFKKYLKYATLQGGLFGLFTTKTPKELIEGYYDPLVVALS